MTSLQTKTKAGSTLIVALGVVAVVSLLIGSYFLSLIPKYRSVHQATSWHDSHEAAVSGANYAVQTLNSFARTGSNADSYGWASDWSGRAWTVSGTDGAHTLNSANLPAFGGKNRLAVTNLVVDVYTRHPTFGHPWFRIRSSARADVPQKLITADRRDLELRRMSLKAVAAGAPDPHVTRTVEVIVRPRFRYSRAITTLNDLSLGNSSNWMVDSFDSGDTAKSDSGTTAGGVYPSAAAKQQSNGGVATQKAEPAGTLYGPLISGNGAVVKGDVQTVGGDDPSTTAHENVSGSGGMTQSRITADFDEDLQPVAEPVWTGVTATAAASAYAVPLGTTASAPKRYIVTGAQGPFDVTAPSSGTGYVEILIKGNLNLGSGNKATIVIPPTVFATVYVDGNVDFGNGDVNSANGNSKVATHLFVYGVSTAANASFSASGNAVQTLAFYGPNYAVSFNGTVETFGAVVGKSFSISGGGNGGFHYDEALSQGGPIAGWQVAGYYEDARLDVQ